MTAPAFALIGTAGYIAPRHMKALAEVGGVLAVAYDPNDSVGVIDSYFTVAHFFVEFERFDRHVDKLRRRAERIDYVSVCLPNYLHDAHVRFALRSDANAICEKPLVLNPWNIDGQAEIERDTNRKINTILQLQVHPTIAKLKNDVAKAGNRRFSVDLTYITSRGRWYHASWKGKEAKSGGVATNIGIQFYDMLMRVFDPVRCSHVHLHTRERAAGFLELEKAGVRRFLSVDVKDLPPEAAGKCTYRSIALDGTEFEFSEEFTDLYTASYRRILSGKGFGLNEVRPSIEIVSAMRTAPIALDKGELHPFVARHMS